MADDLERRLARRMLPLAALAAVVVAVLPPLTAVLVTRHRLAGAAAVHAEHLARRLAITAARQPVLWPYGADKVVTLALGRQTHDLGRVRVLGCDGHALLGVAGLGGLGSGRGGGPAREAAVVVEGRTVAWVRVDMDSRGVLALALPVGAAALLVGALLGLLLYWLPRRVTQRQAARLRTSIGSLEAAEARLQGANRELEARVAAAVTEVRALSTRVGLVQEEERRRIARDLHDSVGQALTALGLALELAAARPDEAPRRLADCVRACEETLREVRRVVHDLLPPELAGADLADTLRECTERFERRTGIAVSFRVAEAAGAGAGAGVAQAAPAAAACLLRVLQEALANVARHADAREAGVVLGGAAGRVTLEISDEGGGFDPAGARGSGLPGMRERAAMLGGRVEIVSALGQGTRIVVDLPASSATATTS
ncbi:MAG: sensor histidine kinase [Deltaproteobacteria bacterium]|nr:sensor histidine kinase [Deltaproteobacteria bacterium]